MQALLKIFKNYSNFSSMFLHVMQIEDDYVSIHVVFLWKFLPKKKTTKLLLNNKKTFLKKKNKIKIKNIKQMKKMENGK
jgi:hypothetical protein